MSATENKRGRRRPAIAREDDRATSAEEDFERAVVLGRWQAEGSALISDRDALSALRPVLGESGGPRLSHDELWWTHGALAGARKALEEARRESLARATYFLARLRLTVRGLAVRGARGRMVPGFEHTSIRKYRIGAYLFVFERWRGSLRVLCIWRAEPQAAAGRRARRAGSLSGSARAR